MGGDVSVFPFLVAIPGSCVPFVCAFCGTCRQALQPVAGTLGWNWEAVVGLSSVWSFFDGLIFKFSEFAWEVVVARGVTAKMDYY